jgi:hypothetical protein
LYDDVELPPFLCLKRLQWASHILRMDNSRIPKKVMEGLLEEEGLWESLQENGRMLYICSRYGTGRRQQGTEEEEEMKKEVEKNLLHTYSTSRLPCFPICCAQHMENVAMDSNNQPWNVLFNPV